MLRNFLFYKKAPLSSLRDFSVEAISNNDGCKIASCLAMTLQMGIQLF